VVFRALTVSRWWRDSSVVDRLSREPWLTGRRIRRIFRGYPAAEAIRKYEEVFGPMNRSDRNLMQAHSILHPEACEACADYAVSILSG
jgi:hypothetical protein